MKLMNRISGDISRGLAAVTVFATCGWQLSAGPLIIDHSSVEKYQQISPELIRRVSEMWLSVPGESHSLGYRKGCELLEAADSRFNCQVQESGVPMSPTNYLRVCAATWGDVTGNGQWVYSYGEEDWYTSAAAIAMTKGHLAKCNTNNLGLAAMGFGWCWDATWHNPPGGGIDPVYQVRWAGSSTGGPDGDMRWGLDAGDYALTGNRICMDDYLSATQQYDDFCKTNNFKTRVFFTTGAIDSSAGESGYQQQIKYDYMRDYVRNSNDAILFDYADILAWSNGGQQSTDTWTDHGGTLRTFQKIHPDNMLDLNGTYVEDGDHIGQRGALRLGKAQWYMLAAMVASEPVTLSAALTGDGALEIEFMAYGNCAYELMTSTNLSVWSKTLEISPKANDRYVVLLDHSVASAPKRFYRIVKTTGP